MDKHLENKMKKIFSTRTFRSYASVIIGSIIYSMTVVWVLNLGHFYGGGVTGISQLISGIVAKYTGKFFSLGLLIGLLNIPLFLLGWRTVSKRFAILTIISIVIQTSLVTLLEHLNYNPFNELVDQRLLLAIFGGAVSGVGASLCLRAGGSTGGMDVVSNTLMIKKGKSFTRFAFLVDFIIIALSAVFFDVETAIFTVIRLLVYLISIRYLYNTYEIVKLEIITSKEIEIREVLLNRFSHSLTMYGVVGGYTLQPKHALEIFISTYEINDYITIIQKVDPKAFISIGAVKRIIGNYVKKTIV